MGKLACASTLARSAQVVIPTHVGTQLGFDGIHPLRVVQSCRCMGGENQVACGKERIGCRFLVLVLLP